MVSSKAATVADYLDELPPERREVMSRVRDAMLRAMPDGYREGMGYGMLGWVVPLEDYPDTYNKQPLAYAGLAAQKNSYSLYLTCAYSDPARTKRLHDAAAAMGKKLDMGKSCIRFKRVEDLPLDAICDELASTSPAEFIRLYEEARSRKGDC
ncbi:DUF1801 domain-containing protein [Sphingomonas rhizophila]|uniref:DUF1801 domain-containing protein n=1 Tax=Sphingomonas rhizophila TaxID=2071607 RepID=A0A7G9S9P1_9SPHN|nr:DUF1801 domain-containing protein [Sphingomonas rhizophila]QNN64566.1 DUF1801 domain-containing protein [Sphingomonas rhizophila]